MEVVQNRLDELNKKKIDMKKNDKDSAKQRCFRVTKSNDDPWYMGDSFVSKKWIKLEDMPYLLPQWIIK